MKISAKGEYALSAVLELSRRYQDRRPIHVQEIARRQDIPLPYLVQILLELKRLGLVRSKRGAEGGYYLARPPDEITLGDVVRGIEGPLLPLDCLGPEEDLCRRASSCSFKPVWRRLRDAMAQVVDGVTFADLRS